MRRRSPYDNRLKPMVEDRSSSRYALAGAIPFLGTGIILLALFNFVKPPWWAVLLLITGVFFSLCLVVIKIFKRRDLSRWR